jgi:hypothetical protein
VWLRGGRVSVEQELELLEASYTITQAHPATHPPQGGVKAVLR